EKDRGRLDNVQHFLARAVLEQSRTWATRPASREAADKNLTGTITRWEDLRSRHPHIPMYREWLGTAHRTRGELRARMGRVGPAGEDFEKARTVLEPLVAEFPALPGYRS